MKFSFSEEQTEFRNMLRRFLRDRSPTTEVRRVIETEAGYDPEVWRVMAEDLGVAAIHIPEAYGGAGFGISELAIAAEEAGRALLPSPFFGSTVLAATAIAEAGTDAQKQALLPGIAAGGTIAALAAAEPRGGWNAGAFTATASPDNGSWRLSGRKSYVLDGMIADLVVAAARLPEGGLGLFSLPTDSAGLARRALRSMDPTRRLAEITFDGAPAVLLGGPAAGGPAWERVLDIAAICLAGEMVGGAERLREDALEYVSMRIQFGRSIASFQVTKHKAADMLLEVELAKAAAYYAAAAADDDEESDQPLAALASLAKAAAADTYMQTAVHAVQMHGGIGFTHDNDTQLWFKRAKASEVFLGSAADHRERMLQQWNA
ncbi:MAG: acyl-CoA/acyl-ACP dehydrogenase [Alphaproteobacteria bacterium]|nr:acyl-CoA/acyl-ACP dehydrogenase [Alphaproteobacteria bacterium]